MLIEHKVRPVLIEGYAALFGVPDLAGDVVRGGAFIRGLSRGQMPPMLLQHRSGAIVGRWLMLREDGHGLFARGLIETDGARALVREGLNGLSIGFRPLMWMRRASGGRELSDIELVEVSLVAEPMQPSARFAPIGAHTTL
ncbi:MAG: HK97 family phage prohead protease [Hyphomonadaceae bacterium]